jgi:hypothetical protein
MEVSPSALRSPASNQNRWAASTSAAGQFARRNDEIYTIRYGRVAKQQTKLAEQERTIAADGILGPHWSDVFGCYHNVVVPLLINPLAMSGTEHDNRLINFQCVGRAHE